jgi:predicted enzyme related to lactoylglutathione lyase
VTRIAPIFPVQNLEIALQYYERLGFATRTYAGSEEYGFASLGDVELHLGVVPDGKAWTPHTAYLFVDDADATAQQWMAKGIEVNLPEDTEWGQHEGVVIDPDGNIIRFGSPIK